MIKNKKLLIFASLFILNTQLFAYADPNDKSFKDGFEAGLEALKFQAKVDGFDSKKVKIDKPYLLTFNISKMPLNEALFLQIISSREGYETHLTREFVSFGAFERKVDAQDRIKDLTRKFKLNSKDFSIHSQTNEIITYPYLFDRFYISIIKEVKDLGFIVQTQIIEKPVIKKQIIKEAKKSTPKNIYKIFNIKGSKAMSYINKGLLNDSKSYEENEFIYANNQSYKLEKEIVTKTNEKFVKVLNENLYFAIDDVNIKN